jgi:hypothetical protein
LLWIKTQSLLQLTESTATCNEYLSIAVSDIDVISAFWVLIFSLLPRCPHSGTVLPLSSWFCRTKRCVQMISSLAVCSTGPEFRSRSEDRLSWLSVLWSYSVPPDKLLNGILK